MKTALREIQRIFESITLEESCIPGTLLYNEGWLLRLVFAAGSEGIDCLPFRFEPKARWFSEALLYSKFLPRSRGDRLAESLTHADGVVGQFEFDAATKAGLRLKRECSQFVICEAKVFSGLSTGTKRAPTFDQAARNVGCMAETLRRAGQPIPHYKSLGFFVLAPASRIEEDKAFPQMSRDGIRDRLRERVRMYDDQSHAGLQKWLSEWVFPLVDRMELSCCSWESIIKRVSAAQPEYGESLGKFYQLCLHYNRPAGAAAMQASS